jgi:integrase
VAKCIRRAAEEATAEARRTDPDAKAFEPIDVGALRHSYITWLFDSGCEVRVDKVGGLSLGRVADLVGHESKMTTKTFYLESETPPMGLVPLKLEHPDDPPVTSTGVHGSRRRAAGRTLRVVPE